MTESRRELESTADPLVDLHALFHRLWTKAHDSPSYEKAEWLRLEALIARLKVRT